MTEDEVRLVKRSWHLLRKIDPTLLADVFYSRLFINAPGLRTLFTSRMDDQYRKLIAMLDGMVASLEQPERFAADVKRLGQRHAGYGVKPHHYDLVGKALLWTLESALGRDWNPAVRAAWQQCYREISETMQG